MGDATRELQREYLWPVPELPRLGDLLKELATSWCGKDDLYGQNTRESGGFTISTTYDSLEEWLGSLGGEVSSAWVTLRGEDRRKITVNWDARQARLTLTVTNAAEKKTEELEAVHETVKARLGLRAKATTAKERSFLAIGGNAAVKAAIEQCREFAGSAATFTASWEDPSGIRPESGDEAEWLAAKAVWKRGEWWAAGHDASLELRDDDRDVTIRLRSWDSERVSKGIEKAGSIAGLQPRAARGAGKMGDARRYFLSQEATLEWYERALGKMQPFAAGSSSFWGRVSGRVDGNVFQRGYGDVELWRAALKAGLQRGGLERSYCSYQSASRGITFELDHVRDLLTVDVQSTLLEEVESTHAALVSELKLARAPENAWRYRRWGRTYEVKWQDGEVFAKQLGESLDQLFHGRRVVPATATLHVGRGDEQVLSFDDLDRFLEAMGTTKELAEVHLVANGPRGEFMGVHLEAGLTRMRLLANAELAGFRQFERQIGDALRSMKLKETYDTDSGGGAAAVAKPEKSGVWVPVLVAVLALAGTLVGSELFKALREEAVLNIDVPVAKDGVAEVGAGSQWIEWTVKEPQLMGRPAVNTRRTARLDVTRRSDSRPVADGVSGEGRYLVEKLAEGEYTVRVSAEGIAPKTVVLRVKK